MSAVSSSGSTGLAMCVWEAGLEREGSIFRSRVRRQRQGSDLTAILGAECPYLADQHVSVIARHADVADQHVRPPATQGFERFVG